MTGVWTYLPTFHGFQGNYTDESITGHFPWSQGRSPECTSSLWFRLPPPSPINLSADYLREYFHSFYPVLDESTCVSVFAVCQCCEGKYCVSV